MYALIAAIPIFLTVILMVGFNWPAKRPCPHLGLLPVLLPDLSGKWEYSKLVLRLLRVF